MGRNNKKGLNYFTLDVSFSDSIKLASIEAGNNAISVLIELWQKIYGSHGYYMDFEEDHKLLFISSALTKITIDELDKIINIFFKRGIFSKKHYDQYQILTSDSIQERFINSCIISKRTNTIIYFEYLCCEIPEENKKWVTIRSKNIDNYGINDNDIVINTVKHDNIQNNSGNIPENSGNIPNNSGKSTYKIDIKENIDIEPDNSGKNKNNLFTFSEIITELKLEGTQKNLILAQYKTDSNTLNKYIDFFSVQYTPETETETFSLNEKRIHFKNFLKNNWGKLPQQQEQRPKIKIL